MPDLTKLPFGIKKRQREPDEWDKTIVAFQSPYRLKDLCIDQSLDRAEDTTRVSRQEFKVRLATTEDRRKSASLLIEKMYSWRGYDSPDLTHDPNKITLVAYQEDRVWQDAHPGAGFTRGHGGRSALQGRGRQVA
jgi:hypothetical protein